MQSWPQCYVSPTTAVLVCYILTTTAIVSCLLHIDYNCIVSCLLHTDYNCSCVLSAAYWLQLCYILTPTVVACLLHTDSNGRGLFACRADHSIHNRQNVFFCFFSTADCFRPQTWRVCVNVDRPIWIIRSAAKHGVLTVVTTIWDPLRQSARQQQQSQFQRLWGKHFENVVDVKLPLLKLPRCLPCGQPAAKNSIRFDPQT